MRELKGSTDRGLPNSANEIRGNLDKDLIGEKEGSTAERRGAKRENTGLTLPLEVTTPKLSRIPKK